MVTSEHRLPPGVNRTGKWKNQKKIVKHFFTHILDMSVFAKNENKLLDKGTLRSQEVLRSSFNSEMIIVCEMLRQSLGKTHSGSLRGI